MKITDMRTVLLTGPISNDPSILVARQLRSAAFIEIETDAGLVGLGETYAGYFCPEAVPAIVDFYRPILLGVEELDVPTLWERMYRCGNYWGRVGLGPMVLSGIEGALWDLKGKALGCPVVELLGGSRHESLPAFATGAMANWPEAELRRKVDWYLAQDFRAFKIGVGYYDASTRSLRPVNGVAEAVAMEAGKAALLREHVGPDVDIMFDGHMGNTSVPRAWDLATATAVAKALEPYDLLFFEEPLPYTEPVAYAELARSTSVPIAGGECLTTVAEFRQFADMDALDVAQPDAAHTGGLSECLAVADLFARREHQVAMHVWGAGGSVMQNVHAAFACPNTLIIEQPAGPGGLHTDVYGESLIMREGRIYPPETPGLGIKLTEEVKARYPFVPGSGEFNSVPGKRMTT